jgi:NAD(P)H dehydrogenase (quinone)
MKTLIIHTHPNPQSYNGSLFRAVRQTLQTSGHELQVLDLYAEQFDPVLSLPERTAYMREPGWVEARVQNHVDALRWAEHLVFVHPTWWYGPPAMLKGWLERVWLPGVAFTTATQKGETIAPGLQHIKRLTVITTGGAPWWFLKFIGDPHRKLFTRGLRVLLAKRCKVTWMQLHNMDVVTQQDREHFLEKVTKKLPALTT